MKVEGRLRYRHKVQHKAELDKVSQPFPCHTASGKALRRQLKTYTQAFTDGEEQEEDGHGAGFLAGADSACNTESFCLYTPSFS